MKKLNKESVENDGRTTVVENSNLEELMAQLSRNIVHMFYRKKDGTLREAYGTLNLSYVPVLYWPAGHRQKRDYLVNYWDMEAGGWRAFQKTRFEYFIENEPLEIIVKHLFTYSAETL